MFGDFPRQFWGKEQATGQFRPQAVRLDTSLEGIFTDFSGSSRFILRLQGHVLGWGVFGHVLKKDEARSRVRARLCRIQESGVDCEGKKKHFKSIIAALLHSREHTCVCGKSLCHGVSQPVLPHCVQSPSDDCLPAFISSCCSVFPVTTVTKLLANIISSLAAVTPPLWSSSHTSLHCCCSVVQRSEVFQSSLRKGDFMNVLPCCAAASLSGLYVS